MLASFGVVSLDNHHQAVNEVVAEAADIDEETELLSDDLPVSQVSLNIELLDLTLTRYVANQIAADHSAHKYDLSPRAPPHFI